MRHIDLRAAVALLGALTVVACSEKKPEPQPAYPTAPAPEAAAPTRAEPAPAPPAAEPAPTAQPPTVQPAPPAAEEKPAAPAVRPAPAAPKPAEVKPAPEPAPAPAKPAEAAAPAPAGAAAPAPSPSAHAKVGAQKCKMCHRVQFESWSASPHAAKNIDCESCHGNGGDYWQASVMRDRAKAVAAGLVIPELASCKRCHPKADADLFARVHAHKAK